MTPRNENLRRYRWPALKSYNRTLASERSLGSLSTKWTRFMVSAVCTGCARLPFWRSNRGTFLQAVCARVIPDVELLVSEMKAVQRRWNTELLERVLFRCGPRASKGPSLLCVWVFCMQHREQAKVTFLFWFLTMDVMHLCPPPSSTLSTALWLPLFLQPSLI